MAKANLVLPDGTKVNIDGTAEEVAILLSKFSQPIAPISTPSKSRRKRKNKPGGASSGSKRKVRTGPIGHITALADEGFFKTKRALADIQKKLEEKGHIYAQTSLSPALVRLVRKRALRRIKEKNGWIYVS